MVVDIGKLKCMYVEKESFLYFLVSIESMYSCCLEQLSVFSHNILFYLLLLHLSLQPVSQETLTRRKANCCQYIKPQARQPFSLSE